jgi:hypothetical protein
MFGFRYRVEKRVKSVVTESMEAQHHSTSRYRTYIRISFKGEQQRQGHATSWQLWKKCHGANEGHQRAECLQAVEFGDPSKTDGGKVKEPPNV